MQIGRYEQAGRVLPKSAQDSQLVGKIADRIIEAVGQQNGGGYQSHIKDFQWTITVVDDKIPNAFVLPGGKIVVFTGGLLAGMHTSSAASCTSLMACLP